MTQHLQVVDQGARLDFSFPMLLAYAGPGSPAGVAVAYQAMRRAFGLLSSEQPVARREIVIETAFRGPGARDGFECVTRAVTEGRYLVTADLERPERGATLEQFVFRFRNAEREVTLLVRSGLIDDEFIAVARNDNRTPEDEQAFMALKVAHMDRLLAARPEDIFDVEGPLQEHDGPPP